MLNSVTLIGSSSGRNAGDAALMSCIMDAVNAACDADLLYEIPTIRPSYVRDNYRTRVKPVGMFPWNLAVKILGVPTYRSLMRTDLTLIFDAILFDRSLYNPLFNFLSTLHLLLPRAKKAGKKLEFYNVGVGPVETEAGRRMLREVSELMDFITVRDKASYDILMDLDVQNPRIAVAADAALNEKPSDAEAVKRIFASLDLDPEQDILGLNVNAYLATWSGTSKKSLTREEFVSTYTAALNRVLEKLDVPVLLVATQHLDVNISREVMDRLKSPNKIRLVTNVDHSHYDMKAVVGQLSLLFAMRLHSMILASSSLTPVAGLAYQPKIHHYFEVLGLEEHSLDFGDFSEDRVFQHVMHAWENRAALREALSSRMPALKEKALSASKLVACLHRGEDLDAAYARLYHI